MKYNIIFLLISLIEIIVLLTFYFTLNTPDNRLQISAIFAIPNSGFIESNQLKKVTILLSDNDQNHFNRLFQDYTTAIVDVDNHPFFQYYVENNNWRKAHVIIDNKKYSAKIKSHGRTPTGHKFGKHFSLDLKFKDKPYPLYSKRINLTIYNGIQLTGEILKIIAPKFDLYYPDFELVAATINDQNQYLYFAEERINKHFFSARELPMIIFNKGIDGSLIYNGTEKTETMSHQLENELKDKKKLSHDLKLRIQQDYTKFNDAIFEQNIKELKNYLNLDYLSRLNAFRIIYGSDGHGFNCVNFEMAYDTLSRTFYPIAHRDIQGNTLSNCQNPYDFMDQHNLFWTLLDSDKAFKIKTEQQIQRFLSENSIHSIQTEIDSLHNYYKNAFTHEFTYNNKNYGGDWILKNMRCLKERSHIESYY